MRRFLFALAGISVVNPEIDRVEAELNKASERHEEAANRFDEAVSVESLRDAITRRYGNVVFLDMKHGR